jgi:hypothetical protein
LEYPEHGNGAQGTARGKSQVAVVGALSHATELTLVSLRICLETTGAAVLTHAKENAGRRARVL